MPQESGFFDTTADDPREYPARKFAEYFALFVGNGIFGGGEKLKVTASGKDMNVSINLGYGWINGYMYSVYDAPLVLPIEQATTQDRIDRIVLRLDVSTPVRAIRAIVLQGLPAATPQAPAIVRSGDIYDLSLAQVLVKSNTSTIQPHQITDERLNTQVCGIVTGLINQADTTSIFNEFQSWLRTKTTEYQKQWDDFMKSIQDEGFATTQYVDQKAGQAETNAKSYVDTKPWQRHKVSDDAGNATVASDLNDDLTTGWYMGSNMANAPSSEWYWVEVIRHNNMWCVQNAYCFNRQSYYQRVKSNNSWTPWSQDLFQSGVDAKNRIAGAISAKGVSASANDSFDQLAAKIGQINTGVPLARVRMNISDRKQWFRVSDGGSVSWDLYYIMVTGLSFEARGIIVLFNCEALSSFDIETYPRMWVDGAANYHEIVYRPTLPQLGSNTILPTITPNSFIAPVTGNENYAGRPVTALVFG